MQEQTKSRQPVVPIVSRRLPRLMRLPGDQARATLAMEVVALATGVPASEIRAATRCNARAARARQVAMYLSYVAWGWSLVRIGAAFQRDRTTAGYACRLVEDMRDDRLFDARLERLEACLRAAPEACDVQLLAPDLSFMPIRDAASEA